MNFNFPLAEEILGAADRRRGGRHRGEAGGDGRALSRRSPRRAVPHQSRPEPAGHGARQRSREDEQRRRHPADPARRAVPLLRRRGGAAERAGQATTSSSAPPCPGTPPPAAASRPASPGSNSRRAETANVAAQTGDPDSLLSHYRKLIRLRQSSAALSKGTLTLLSPGNQSTPVLAFVREAEGEKVLVVHNVTDRARRRRGPTPWPPRAWTGSSDRARHAAGGGVDGGAAGGG